MVKYKQKCRRCSNYVLVSRSHRYMLCYDCQKKEIDQEVKDPKMKKMFKIPEEFYKKSSFLRNIKASYLRYGNLTEKQIDTFKNAVKKMKEAKKEGGKKTTSKKTATKTKKETKKK